MKKRKKAAFIIFLAVSSAAYASKGPPGEMSFVNHGVTPDTNIHFNEEFCTECHLEIPGKGQKLLLRFADFTQTCRCHGYTPENYTHPLGTKLSPEDKRKIPKGFPLAEDTITCNTCHDLTLQCDAQGKANHRNGNFLRVNSLQPRSALCYQCHDISSYQRLSPHQQLDSSGKIIKAKCLYCHRMKPDEKKATLKKQRSGAAGTVEFVEEFNTLCFRCHYRQTRQHIINANHLKPPPAKILANIANSEKRLGVIFPLDGKGAVACPTCHNPHQRGIIPPELPGAKGAGERKRLRVTKQGHKICVACHNY
ncbi:MAG: hypothetical protein KQH63_11740 [Desulfobulbaceae bacterium]|nr:hypothetical protein [Desulfobulbaceae bacterium]